MQDMADAIAAGLGGDARTTFRNYGDPRIVGGICRNCGSFIDPTAFQRGLVADQLCPNCQGFCPNCGVSERVKGVGYPCTACGRVWEVPPAHWLGTPARFPSWLVQYRIAFEEMFDAKVTAEF